MSLSFFFSGVENTWYGESEPIWHPNLIMTNLKGLHGLRNNLFGGRTEKNFELFYKKFFSMPSAIEVLNYHLACARNRVCIQVISLIDSSFVDTTETFRQRKIFRLGGGRYYKKQPRIDVYNWANKHGANLSERSSWKELLLEKKRLVKKDAQVDNLWVRLLLEGFEKRALRTKKSVNEPDPLPWTMRRDWHANTPSGYDWTRLGRGFVPNQILCIYWKRSLSRQKERLLCCSIVLHRTKESGIRRIFPRLRGQTNIPSLASEAETLFTCYILHFSWPNASHNTSRATQLDLSMSTHFQLYCFFVFFFFLVKYNSTWPS